MYRQPVSFWWYLGLVPVLFVALGLIFTVMAPVDAFLHDTLFAWMPLPDAGLAGGFSRPALLATYAAWLLLGAIAGPIVEELYFRGYLLPRMNGLKGWAPVAHSLLFSLYHTFTIWQFVTRTVAMLPIIYTARRKNIYIGMIAHVLINAFSVVVGLAVILNMR